MFGEYDYDNLWVLHFDGEADGGDDGADDGDDGADGGDGGEGGAGGAAGKGKGKGKPPAGRFVTQDEIDKMILKGREKDRRQKKELLLQLEGMQETVRMSDEQKIQFESQIETLRKQTMTSDQIAAREAKKANDAYAGKLTSAEKQAKEWEDRYRGLKISYDIQDAARSTGVLPAAVPMLVNHLRPNIKLNDVKNDAGVVTDSTITITFADKGADGNPIETQLSVSDTLKRMKELPDEYGHLFAAPNGGGTGTNSGKPGARGKGFNPNMSMSDFIKARKENPNALYGES